MTVRLREPFADVVDSAVLPKVIHLGGGLSGAAFPLMKLLPARFILSRAAEQGRLDAGTTVIETTSGTFGLGLAMVCRLRDVPLILVGDPAIDPGLRRRLADLGAQVSIVSGPVLDIRGVQQARLDRVARLQARHRPYFTPEQYDNPLNPTSYGMVAELIAEALGTIDALVCPVGSGGSSSGIGSFLRLLTPELRLIGVDTPGSVLFGAAPGPRLLRGLGSGIVPKVLDYTLFDEVHWVGAPEAFTATRELHARRCVYAGPSSGAAYLVARWWAARQPDAKVVVLLPDEGHRYQHTVYNDRWLARHGLLLRTLPTDPVDVDHPSRAARPWTRMEWGRRTRAQVLAEGAS